MSFRSAKTEASLRLYSLPRRELQALCKQYGIPANKTNVKMADALSSCITADNARTKGFSGSSSLGVSKTTLMKLKLERKTELPETSLASFILNGKGKASPAKPTVVAFKEDPSFPKPNTTPLKRGIKRTERPLPTLPEERAISAAPAITRGSAASHDGKSVPSPRPRAPTPRKRTAEIAAVVTRRGGDALPPVSFSDLLSTPKKSELQVHNTTQLTSTGKTAKKMKTRLGGSRAAPQDDEAKAPTLPHVSRGKRVAFADEVEFENTRTRELLDSNPASDQGNQLEPETETIEISYAEIEFKNTPLHRELLGVRKHNPVDEEQDVASAPRETEQAKDVSESLVQPGFEFRDMALHKELFGSTRESNNHVETSAHASHLEAAEPGFSNSPFTSSPEVLVCSDTPLSHNPTVLSSIREDASEQADSKIEVFDEHVQDHLPLGRDLSPFLNDIACDDLAESRCEKVVEVPVCCDKDSPGCSFNDSPNDSVPTSVQEPPATMSPGANVPLVIQEADMQYHQQHLDFHTGNSVVDNLLETEITLETQVTNVNSTPVLHERQKVHTCNTPKTAEIRRFTQKLADKDEAKASPSAEVVMASGSKPGMPDISTFKVPVTSLTKIQSVSESPLEKSGTSLTRIQSNIDSTLARATSILEKLAAWRADAEKKVREGYWEPKFTSVVETASPAVAFKTPVAKPAAVFDMNLPSAKKARPTPKAASGVKKGLVVCEDADIVSSDKVSSDSVNTTRNSDDSRDSSEVSDKENQVDKSMGDKTSRALGGLGKERRKHKKTGVLKDRSKNSSDHASGNDAHGTIKADNSQVRLEGMSLRKLRAQVKEKVKQMETSKVLDVRTQRSWN